MTCSVSSTSQTSKRNLKICPQSKICRAWFPAESKQNPSHRLVSHITRAAEMVEAEKKERKIRSILSELENTGPNVGLQVKVSMFVTWLHLSCQSTQIILLPKEKDRQNNLPLRGMESAHPSMPFSIEKATLQLWHFGYNSSITLFGKSEVLIYHNITSNTSPF